jgi:hypothetical protein
VGDHGLANSSCEHRHKPKALQHLDITARICWYTILPKQIVLDQQYSAQLRLPIGFGAQVEGLTIAVTFYDLI